MATTLDAALMTANKLDVFSTKPHNDQWMATFNRAKREFTQLSDEDKADYQKRATFELNVGANFIASGRGPNEHVTAHVPNRDRPLPFESPLSRTREY